MARLNPAGSTSGGGTSPFSIIAIRSRICASRMRILLHIEKTAISAPVNIAAIGMSQKTLLLFIQTSSVI